MRNLEQGVVLYSRYKIIDLIGSGGTSNVYLAENVKVGSLVAVKVVPKNLGKLNLIAEKELLKELRHSAIPIIVDIEEDQDYLYLVEEYVEGTALVNLKLQLSEEEMIDVMLQLCDVLQYLHTSLDKPILYRDLKPENIIRMNNGRIKLIDFGIAVKRTEDGEDLRTHYGTKGYAAPEQLSYSKSDEKTDIYSMGVSVYYMLTGKNLSQPPYRLQPIRELNSDISAEFAAIISKCIETLPAKRYQNVAQIVHDLTSVYEKDKSEQDYLTFKNHSKTVITCSGIKHGIGTTHLTFLLARYFKSMDRRVAVVEWQKRDDLIKLASMYPEIEEGRFSYKFQGIDCHFYIGGCDYEKALDGFYDVIIIDAGAVDEIEGRGGWELSDELLVVCGSKDWELDYFEDLVYGSGHQRNKYLFNFTSEEDYNKIAKQMVGVSCQQLPYNANPYIVSEEVEAFFSKLFIDGQLVESIAEKGVIHEVKNLFEKQIARIAKG